MLIIPTSVLADTGNNFQALLITGISSFVVALVTGVFLVRRTKQEQEGDREERLRRYAEQYREKLDECEEREDRMRRQVDDAEFYVEVLKRWIVGHDLDVPDRRVRRRVSDQ